MRSATGGPVDPLDLDEPHVTFVPVREAAAANRHAPVLRRAHANYPDGSCLAHQLHHRLFEGNQLFTSQRGDVELDVAPIGTEVERRRVPPEPV